MDTKINKGTHKRGTHCNKERGGHTAKDSKEGDTLHWTPGSSSSPAMKVHQRST